MFFCSNCSTAYGKEKSILHCLKTDREYAQSWKNSYDYDPEEAYIFGETIKKLVKEKNLKSIFDLVEGELTSGPRKNFVRNKNFSDIFSNKWRNSVLKSKSPCSPMGWRGFMLDQGSIWYNKDQDKNKWYIVSINGAKNEKISETKLPIAWKVSGKIIPPQCFSTLWLSSENYEKFSSKFNIKHYKYFLNNPGKFLGKKIPNLEPIHFWDEKIYLAAPLKECFKGNLRDGSIVNTTNFDSIKDKLRELTKPPLDFKNIISSLGKLQDTDIKISNKSIYNTICSTESPCTEYAYTILSKIPLQKCNSLAPHITGKCEASFLISVGNNSGGSMGWYMSYNIYGLFSFNDDKKYIIPLKSFDNKNNAINYIKGDK